MNDILDAVDCVPLFISVLTAFFLRLAEIEADKMILPEYI